METVVNEPTHVARTPTGVEGLDTVLRGGLPAGRMHLVYGRPGVGKTTLALQFLLDGARRGEAGVYVALSETAAEIRDIAGSHGWAIPEQVHLCDFQRGDVDEEGGYTLFHPSEIELTDTTHRILETLERVRPGRVVFDSLSEMRLMARDSLRYRRQVLALKNYFADQGCTVLLLDTRLGHETGEFQLETLTHGVVELEQLAQDYGETRRRLRVEKMRGVNYVEGFHDFRIRTGGLAIFPRLGAYLGDRTWTPATGQCRCNVPALDAMTGGGLDRGTTTMVIGPAGVGKSTLVTQYSLAALRRGERVAIFLFDEDPNKWRLRAHWLGHDDIEEHVSSGRLLLRYVNPAELSPGEFASIMRSVQELGAEIVVVDSFNGYRSAMPEERFLTLHLHELFSYLNRHGVLTLVVAAQHGFVGEALDEPFKLSYLADSVLVMRYFEAYGRVRKAISMIKRRTGPHERFIRELDLGPEGITIGEPLSEFSGILAGELSFRGGEERLLDERLGEADGAPDGA